MTRFVNPENIIAQLDLPKGVVAIDLGCGGGFYTLALAKAVGEKGTVYAVDILPDKLAVTESAAQMIGCKNITIVRADLEKPLDSVAPGSCDLAVIANIMHQVKARDILIENIYRVLKTGGRALVVDWKKELTAFGPPMASRVSQEQLSEFLQKRGFRHEKDLEADGYHYATVFIK